ncbi:arginase family protein [bacterium]|nr:arginase family protein [bacterium]
MSEAPGAVAFPTGRPGSLAAHVSSGQGAGRVALLGLPNDEGVAAGGGRRGAAEGPDGLRLALARFGTTHLVERQADLVAVRVDDLGDLPLHGLPPGESHPLAQAGVEAAARDAEAIVVLGGGHDLCHPVVRGAAEAWGEPAGLNVDPHLDMRAVAEGGITSGTPYRRLILDGTLAAGRLLSLGASGLWNSPEDLSWARERGVSVRTLAEHRRRPFGEAAVEIAATLNQGDWAFVDIDLDCLSGAAASAPGPEGFSVAELCDLAYLAGTLRSVRLLGLYEHSPRHDRDEVGARAAILVLAHFLAGVAARAP